MLMQLHDCIEQYIMVHSTYLANCGPPSRPPNSYIIPYSTTIEGGVVTFLCWNDDQQSKAEDRNITCNRLGIWEPTPSEVCGLVSNSGNSLLKYCRIHYHSFLQD